MFQRRFTSMSRRVFSMRWILLAVAVAVPLAGGCGARNKSEKTPSPDLSRGDSVRPSESGSVPASATETVRAYELSDIRFDFDRANIRGGDREILLNHGKWLADNEAVRVLIEGHCDERGTVEYNLALGERRAKSARDFLVDYGIARDRLDVISYGKERPLDLRHNEEAWALNRRAHFVKR
jgi:peptidoglycan-associated lipoprotein